MLIPLPRRKQRSVVRFVVSHARESWKCIPVLFNYKLTANATTADRTSLGIVKHTVEVKIFSEVMVCLM